MEIKFLQQAHVSGIDKPKQRIGFCNIWVIMCFLNGVNYHAVPRQVFMLAMPLAHMHTICYTMGYCIPYNCSITEHRAREEISNLG